MFPPSKHRLRQGGISIGDGEGGNPGGANSGEDAERAHSSFVEGKDFPKDVLVQRVLKRSSGGGSSFLSGGPHPDLSAQTQRDFPSDVPGYEMVDKAAPPGLFYGSISEFEYAQTLCTLNIHPVSMHKLDPPCSHIQVFLRCVLTEDSHIASSNIQDSKNWPVSFGKSSKL